MDRRHPRVLRHCAQKPRLDRVLWALCGAVLVVSVAESGSSARPTSARSGPAASRISRHRQGLPDSSRRPGQGHQGAGYGCEGDWVRVRGTLRRSTHVPGNRGLVEAFYLAQRSMRRLLVCVVAKRVRNSRVRCHLRAFRPRRCERLGTQRLPGGRKMQISCREKQGRKGRTN